MITMATGEVSKLWSIWVSPSQVCFQDMDIRMSTLTWQWDKHQLWLKIMPFDQQMDVKFPTKDVSA